MAKVQQKSEKITAFGGIFFVLDKFDSILSSVIDSHLGLRSRLIGYQYSEIIRAVFSVFCCGGDCMEDLNLYLKDVLSERPHTRVPSADTVLRGIEELATENISYTAEKTGNVYDFNTAEKLNQLLIKLLLATGQLTEGGEYDVDYSAEIIGMWEGRMTSEQSVYGDVEDHRWEYMTDGSFNYFRKVDGQWQISDDDYADYFVDGNLLCTRWKNEGAGNEEHREWWEIESIENGVMKWKALRQKEDGTTYTATFEMTKVTE